MKLLNQELEIAIRQHAEESYPFECCGFISPDGKVVKCINISKRPMFHFQVDDIGFDPRKMSAYYHSHNELIPTFSEPDKLLAEKLNIKAVLLATVSGNFLEYEPIGYEIPYTNRPFLLGVMDCLVLLQDYYQREFNIEIDYYEHPVLQHLNWHTTDFNVESNGDFKKHLIENGFFEVKSLRGGDIILMRDWKIKCASHCAIYEGGNRILHHPAGKQSVLEDYNQYMKQRTLCFLRHVSLS